MPARPHRTVDRVIQILETVSLSPRGITLAELAAALGAFAGPACIGQWCAADAPRFIRYDTKDAQDLLGELVIGGRIVSIGMSDDQSAQPQQCTSCRGERKLRMVDMETSGADCGLNSSQATARVGDLYELCGRAMRGAKWRPPLLHLSRRSHVTLRFGHDPRFVPNSRVGTKIETTLPHRPRAARIIGVCGYRRTIWKLGSQPRDVTAVSLLGDNLLAGRRLVTTMPNDRTCT